MQCRHESVSCVEGYFIEPCPFAADMIRIEAGLHRQRCQRSLHGIAFDLPIASLPPQLSVVAQHPAPDDRTRSRNRCRIIIVILGCQLAFGHIA